MRKPVLQYANNKAAVQPAHLRCPSSRVHTADAIPISNFDIVILIHVLRVNRTLSNVSM